MTTQRIEVGKDWVQLTSDTDNHLIECISGFVLINESDAEPDEEAAGHPLKVNDWVNASKSVWAKTNFGYDKSIVLVS